MSKGRKLYRSGRRTSVSVLIAVLALVTGFGLGAVVTAATGIDGGSRSAHAASGADRRAAKRPPKTSRAEARRRRRESHAIDATLRYTRFLATGTRRHRVIALTFDDGPGPYTRQIVSALARLHAPATFFVVGQQLGDFAAELRDEVDHDFVIGDHTENHAWLGRLTADAQYRQINQAAVRIKQLGAPFPRLFRPPYGIYNGQTLSKLRLLKMLMVMWSIDPGDWRRPGTPAIVSNVLAHARPGAIVIMHDGGGDRTQTVAALPAIIRGLRRQHYGLVTVSQLLTLDPPPRHQRLPRLGAA